MNVAASLSFLLVAGCNEAPTTAPIAADAGNAAGAGRPELQGEVDYLESVPARIEAATALMRTEPAKAGAALQALLAEDARRADKRRMSPEMLALVRMIAAQLDLASGHAVEARAGFEALLASRETLDAELGTNIGGDSKLRLGDFAGAFETLRKGPDPEDGAHIGALAEAAALARREEAPALLTKAITLASTDEERAVFAAYRAIAEASRGETRQAVASVDAALAAAARVTAISWTFGTLRPPFAGKAPWERCAAAFYEPLRALPPTNTAFATFTTGAEGLRGCVAKLRAATR